MIDYEHVEMTSRARWRSWLAAHHDSSGGIWLVTWKKGRGPHVPYDDVVDEALCFGWVDGRAGAVDADRSRRLLTPRRSGSSWSRVNKARVARLTAVGLMTPAGQAVIDAAVQHGGWTALDAVEALIEPDDLRAALDAEPGARTHWDAFPRSTRRAILEWVQGARTPGTRARRIAETAAQAAVGIRANQWRQPKHPP